ncbi:glycosyltransferase [Rhizobium sp. LC145]|uniref:glycosyltransferase n=1 Tax=Rhizobium sp. LC145 TaxID=1120688 RepID=UPI000B05A961|nr:glycosyltransferase [Rhizobium sp. LC145]
MSLNMRRPSSADEIWYVSFERLESRGGGLGTYVRQVKRAAETVDRAIRIFQNAANGVASRRADGNTTIIDVPMIETPAKDALGYWMHLSLSFAEAILEEISNAGPPKAIEFPDGFATGYFLFQKKLVGDERLQGVPLLLCAHTPISVIEEWIGIPHYALPNWWTFRAEKWCFKAADAVITLSGMMDSLLEQKGFFATDTIRFRSVNPYLPSPKASIAAQAQRSLTVGMASRMVNWKGLPQVISLAEEADRQNLPIVFELCGHITPDYEVFQKSHKELFQSGRVIYLGTLGEDELQEKRAQWACQLHPSPRDNFPYTVIECLSAGLPCLITKDNGVSEVISDELGEKIVVDFEDSPSVIEKILHIDEARQILEAFDLSIFSPESYFCARDRLIESLAKGKSVREKFPFVDADQSRGGLRTMVRPPATASGARLTVVIPYYNMGHYVEETIQSVLRSSAATEIILVNDGSSDRSSIQKLGDYRGRDRIRVLDTPNSGVAVARNFGVAQVDTEFVALLNADDTVEPTYYEKAIKVLDRYDNVGFVGSWCNDISDINSNITRHWVTYNAEPMPNIVINNTNCQSLVYRTELYQKHGEHDPDLKMYLDNWDGMLGMLEGGCFGVMLPEALFNYRQRAGSIFSSGRSAWEKNYASIVRKRVSLFEKNAPEVVLFLNANGSNWNYHLLGQPSQGFLPELASPAGDYKLPHRLARSLAKRLMRFADKGRK